jgi:hypothetical protein
MPTQQQVEKVLSGSRDFAAAAELLRVPPGRAYLIATGRPADSSTPGSPLGSRAQALMNPREVNPTSRGDVHAWIRRLAYSDPSMRARGSEPGGDQ